MVSQDSLWGPGHWLSTEVLGVGEGSHTTLLLEVVEVVEAAHLRHHPHAEVGPTVRKHLQVPLDQVVGHSGQHQLSPLLLAGVQ